MARLMNLMIPDELMKRLEEAKKGTGNTKSTIVRNSIINELKRMGY